MTVIDKLTISDHQIQPLYNHCSIVMPNTISDQTQAIQRLYNSTINQFYKDLQKLMTFDCIADYLKLRNFMGSRHF